MIQPRYSMRTRVCSALLAGVLACSGAGAAVPSAFADEATAQARSAPQAAFDQLAPQEAPAFEKNASYTVPVVLRSAMGNVPGDLSRTNELINHEAIVDVNNKGEQFLTLRFIPGVIAGSNASATDFKIFKKGESDSSLEPDMTKFADGQTATLGEDNSLIVQIKLPYMEESGNYLSEIFSAVMNSQVYLSLDWSSLNRTSTVRDRLKAVVEAAESLEEKSYYAPSWKVLHNAVVQGRDILALDDESAEGIVAAIQGIEAAQKKLRTTMEKPLQGQYEGVRRC